MDLTVEQELGQRGVKGDLGIEIEAEGGLNIRRLPAQWKVEEDPSLEAGYELVLRNPLVLHEAIQALNDLNESYAKADCVPEFTIRTSTHVHVNVQKLKTDELYSFILLYWIYEELLIDFCGEERVSNFYCLRRKDAEVLQNVLECAIKSGNLWVLDDDIRYASVNFKSLFSFGSLEFRGMRGTTDPNVLVPWMKMLLALRDKATHYSNCVEMFLDIEETGLVKFTRSLFGAEIFKQFLHQGWTRSIKESYQELRHIPLFLPPVV